MSHPSSEDEEQVTPKANKKRPQASASTNPSPSSAPPEDKKAKITMETADVTKLMSDMMDKQKEQLELMLVRVAEMMSGKATAIKQEGDAGAEQMQVDHPRVDGEAALKLHMRTLKDSILLRLPKFTFNEESGATFEAWYARYKDVILKDGDVLEKEDQRRIVLEKLDEDAYERFMKFILPKKAEELDYAETIGKLTELFSPVKSLISRRFAFSKLRFPGGDMDDLVKHIDAIKFQYERAEMRGISEAAQKSLSLLLSLKGPENETLRAQIMKHVEEKPDASLDEVYKSVKHYMTRKEDAKLEKEERETFAVRRESRDKDRTVPKSDVKRDVQCYNCGGPHFKRECPELASKPKEKRADTRRDYRKRDRRRVDHKKPSAHAHSTMVASTQTQGLKGERLFHNVEIDGKKLRMRVDTGADVTMVKHSDWKQLGSPRLSRAKLRMTAANGSAMHIYGMFKCQYALNGKAYFGECNVVDGVTLLGMDWLKPTDAYKKFRDALDVTVCAVNEDAEMRFKQELEREYPAATKEGLGLCTKMEVRLQLKSDATPKFCKARPVPFGATTEVAAEIERLVTADVLRPVDFSNWAAPIVAIKKKNGTMRMCADFSTGLNAALEDNHHPLPTADEIFAQLNGGTIFTQIDLSEAYLQLAVDKESQELLTINTHRGLFQFQRLPFGVKTAPAIFQKVMNSLINGLDGTAAYLDDIIVMGTSKREHDERVKKVFARLHDFGMNVRLEKCTFGRSQIKFLGFIIDADGRRPDPIKIAAIKDMPAPTTLSELRSFLGAVQFYGSFVSKLSLLRKPLDDLCIVKNSEKRTTQHSQKKTKLEWTKDHELAFAKIKEVLMSDLLLCHYDPAQEIVVAADASEYGIGCVISHRKEGCEKAIQHCSRKLTETERRYSQIEKEALALVYAVKKFHRYILGRKFLLKTDHKPLLAVFGSSKGIPIYSANRLQRWATTLLNYDFKIEYVRTDKFGQADVLSRLIASRPNAPEDRMIAHIDAEDVDVAALECPLPTQFQRMKRMTAKDGTLLKVMDCVRKDAWPAAGEDELMSKFYNRRSELEVRDELLMWRHRVVVPKLLQPETLKMLHQGHQGAERMKTLARSFVYWPNIDADLEKVTKSCDVCAQFAKSPLKNNLHSWPLSHAPWSRIHLDFAGPIEGQMLLIIVDAYSKWVEAVPMKTADAQKTVEVMDALFARYGLPEVIVSDNGRQFANKFFDEWCTKNGIRHMFSPPYHPQSNGQAERYVDVCKRAVLKAQAEGTPMVKALECFLQAHRSTPGAVMPNGKSPAELFLGRKLRVPLTLFQPRATSMEKVDEGRKRTDLKQEAQFNRHWNAKDRMFSVKDLVYVKDYRGAKTTWIRGMIVAKMARTIYKVKLDDGLTWTRHANQLRKRAPDARDTSDKAKEAARTDKSSTREQMASSSAPKKDVASRAMPTRTRRAPRKWSPT